MANDESKIDESRFTSDIHIPEDASRLVALEGDRNGIDVARILESLRQDCVVLVRNLNGESADQTVHDIAKELGLDESLRLHAGFASLHGHRHNINKYFMSVNKRADYHFIPPHSEGTSFSNIQLAAFFCTANTTNGGETILMNVDSSSPIWESLAERVKKAKIAGNRPLSAHEIARARAQHQINLPTDILREDDTVLFEGPTENGLTVVEVLTKPRKSHSRILDRSMHAYWDSVASIDHAALRAYVDVLRQVRLLREPLGGMDLQRMDNAADRRVWDSKVDHRVLFKSKITVKLAPGDLVLQNNLSWTHAVCNWTPRSGIRKLAAAFA